MTEKPQTVYPFWRSFFWPIEPSEVKKFVHMLIIFFLITFNYNLLRIFKDSLVVTARDSGAEALPFIKVWGILPMAIIFTFLFTKLSNKYSREKVFYIMMSIFLSFFFLFAAVLYPAREFLHPHDFADKLQAILPTGFKGLIAMFRNWTFTAFYIMSELWSTAILTVLFWGFANEVTSIKEARRFYGMFATGGNIAAILSGVLASALSKEFFFSWLPYGKEPWEQGVLFSNCIVLICGAFTLILYRRLHRYILKQDVKKDTPKEVAIKPKMSIRESFSYLAKSKYLFLIAFIVLAYNLGINLVEVVWKNQINQLYPDPSSYNTYMSHIMTATGAIAALASLFLTSGILRKFSWTTAALIPPCMMLLTGVLFFSFILFPESPLSGVGIFLGFTPLFMSVTFGAIQNCITRASKYTLFDATKELAFIPLDSDTKLRGKAAIDGVGSRLGKSGGSIVHQGLLLLCTTVSASVPYIALVFLFVAALWVYSVVLLGKKFEDLTGVSSDVKPSQRVT